MNTFVEDKEQKCLECGASCINRRSLGNHLVRSHKELGGQKAYVLKHFLDGKIPLCKCGCGNHVVWHKLLYKFNEYVTGHNTKSKGVGFCAKDFKHTPAQIEKRNKSIRETYARNKKDLSEKIGKSVSNAFKDPEKNRHLREGQTRGWDRNTQRKEDLVRRNIEMLRQGIIGPHAPFKIQWKHNPFTGQEEFMHSSWETAFLETCISRGYPVTKEHGIAIPYVHPDGTQHSYVPDFYGFEDRVLYEVKGRIGEADDAKWRAAEEWCAQRGFSFQVLLEEPE